MHTHAEAYAYNNGAIAISIKGIALAYAGATAYRVGDL
jgi:hypothetical protein